MNISKLLDIINPLHSSVIDKESKLYKSFQTNRWPVPSYYPVEGISTDVMKRSLDQNSILLSTLCLIRNLSFDKNNETYFAYSFKMLSHLTSLLMLSADSSNECSRYLFDIFSNITRIMDVTASLRCRTNYYLEDCLEVKNKYFLRASVGIL